VLPAVGYDHPDQSHFTSRHFWEVGATDTNVRVGWLGRYLDRAGNRDNPLQGLSLDDQLQPALATASAPVATLAAPEDYGFDSPNVWGDVQTALTEAIGLIGAAQPGEDAGLAAARAVTASADRLRRQLAPFLPADDDSGPAYASPVTYPSSDEAFPKRLAGLAAMLAGGLPLRCVALTAPGEYDTHAAHPDALAKGLKLTADSLLAFQRDLERRGLADQVLVPVWSEFGRRAEENGSLGTDHGAAGAGFLIGSRVRGTMLGEFPGLTSGLDADGNLKATFDFRSLYSALIEQWLGGDAADVIPDAAKFARPPLLKA
jgi:uncharacterized protein (DUF1501 family)